MRTAGNPGLIFYAAVLLRSVWTALRIMANFQRIDLFRNISIVLGVGLPILFLAISLPITGVSYRLGNVCVPNDPSALATWFAWLIIFAAISWIIQVATIVYCLWKFASSSLTGPSHGTSGSRASNTTDTGVSTSDDPNAPQKKPLTPGRRNRIAWRKVRSVLALQWRSIVMAFIVVNLTIYFGIVYLQQAATTHSTPSSNATSTQDSAWIACLIANDGGKDECMKGAAGLGLSESRAIGTLVLGSVSDRKTDPCYYRVLTSRSSSASSCSYLWFGLLCLSVGGR